MKVILLKDVAKIGRRFEIVVVPDGYALNKLIPHNMAKTATPENIKMLSAVTAKQKENKAQDQAVFSELLKILKDKKVEIVVDANPEGKLFQSLKNEMVAEAITKNVAMHCGVENVVIKTPIKTLGEHTIELISGTEKGNISVVLISKSK